MTNENTDNTDNTDEPTKAELHNRVQQLESTVVKMMPSRRDALKFGAAGIAGAAGLSATTQPAEASTGSAGEIGDVNNRPDLFADQVDMRSLRFDSSDFLRLESEFSGSGSITQSVPNPNFSDNERLVLEIEVGYSGTQGTVGLRFNGTTNNYTVTNINGSTGTANEIRLYSTTGTFGALTSRIEISEIFKEITATIDTHGRTGRGNVLARRGSKDLGNTLSSIEIVTRGADEIKGRVLTRSF